MSYDSVKNFAVSTLASGISDTDTSLTVQTGDGSKFPDPPFNVVIWDKNTYTEPQDDPNVEIARVTAKSNDTFTITRGQEGTNASSHSAGCRVELNLTAKVIQDLIKQIQALELGVI